MANTPATLWVETEFFFQTLKPVVFGNVYVIKPKPLRRASHSDVYLATWMVQAGRVLKSPDASFIGVKLDNSQLTMLVASFHQVTRLGKQVTFL